MVTAAAAVAVVVVVVVVVAVGAVVIVVRAGSSVRDSSERIHDACKAASMLLSKEESKETHDVVPSHVLVCVMIC